MGCVLLSRFYQIVSASLPTKRFRNLGADRQLLLFEFQKFKIGAFASVRVTDPQHASLLESGAAFQRVGGLRRDAAQMNSSNQWVIHGQRPVIK